MTTATSRSPDERGPRRLAKARDWIAYELGVTGEPQATRRFFRAAIIVRGLLLLATPFFFLLPGPQYEGGLREWVALIGLSAWTAALGYWTYVDDEWVKRTLWIYVVDVSFCFAAFLFITHTAGGTDQGSYGDIVIVGSFQLQTYGPAILGGALTGVPGGLASGAASAVVYLGCLWHIDGDSAVFLDKSHVQGTLARTILYLIFGFTFGLYNSLVGRLRHELRVAAEAEARADAARQFHRSGLNLLDIIASALAGARDSAEEPARTRIARIHQCLRLTTNSLRGAFAAQGPTAAVSAASVIKQTCALLELALDPSTSHMINVSVVEGEFALTPEEARSLDNVISEAVSNAVKYADLGKIHVLGHPVNNGYAVRVTDAGPPQPGVANSEPTGSSGYGLQDIRDQAAAHGWTLTIDVSTTPGHPSMIAIILVPARPLGPAVTPSEFVTEIGQEVVQSIPPGLADA